MYKHVLGCNMAFWKEDLMSVNGYDERFIGWGKEDNDISIRLLNSGVKLRFIKFSCISYHLYHRKIRRKKNNNNEMLFKESVDNNIIYVMCGIKKLIIIEHNYFIRLMISGIVTEYLFWDKMSGLTPLIITCFI